MLSTTEVEKIKQGVERIRQELPDAELEAIVRMFHFVFGHKLSDEEKVEAEQLIVSEWRQWFS